MKEKILLFRRFFVLAVFFGLSCNFVVAQNTSVSTEKTPNVSPSATTQNNQKTVKKQDEKKQEKTTFDPKNPTVDQIASTVLFVYGGLGGSEGLKQIRKTAVERGIMSLVNEQGTTEQINYEKRVLRGDTMDKEKIRFDQESPTTRYALIFNDNKIVGIYNEAVFVPNDEASKGFQNQIWHGIESLLRYKENASTLTLGGREKYMGAEYHIVDLTDKQERKTRYYVSTKTFRVMWLEYNDNNVKYTRRFYDYRNAQGTLVPYRSVLSANGKQIEETQILTVTYGQKLDDTAFVAGE